MGYNATLISADFLIPAEKLDEAFKALKELNKRDDLKGGYAYGNLPGGGYGKTEVYFSWMDADYDKTAKDARHIFEMLGFTTEQDDEGLRLTWYDSKVGDEDHFLNAVAPFVQAGSSLTWEGEDSAHWMHKFDGTIMTHHTGRVIFDD